MYIYVYICMYIYIYVYMYMYVYIYMLPATEALCLKKKKERMLIYIYMHIYIHLSIYLEGRAPLGEASLGEGERGGDNSERVRLQKMERVRIGIMFGLPQQKSSPCWVKG